MRGRSSAVVLFATVAIGGASSQPVSDDIIEMAKLAVEQLRDLPTPLPPGVGTGISAPGERPRIPPAEVLRDKLYRQLHDLGSAGVIALADGFQDADVGLRRNVALALGVLGGGYWPGLSELDIGSALPSLTTALTDADPSVRAWSAQAIGHIGADASSAVPALILLLENEDEGSRNSACIGLRGIGPAASSALPALRRALSDSRDDVRRFARLAIEHIER